jgi:hypothetical protein
MTMILSILAVVRPGSSLSASDLWVFWPKPDHAIFVFWMTLVEATSISHLFCIKAKYLSILIFKGSFNSKKVVLQHLDMTGQPKLGAKDGLLKPLEGVWQVCRSVNSKHRTYLG